MLADSVDIISRVDTSLNSAIKRCLNMTTLEARYHLQLLW